MEKGGAAGVLEVVDALINDYTQAIEENKNSIRQLEAMRDTIKGDHAETVKREENTENQMSLNHKV